MKKENILILSVLFISLVVGVQTTNFNGQGSILSLNFTGDQNITYNISLENNSIVTNATMVLTGSDYVTPLNNNFNKSKTNYDFGTFNFSINNITATEQTGDLYFDRIMGGDYLYSLDSTYSNSTWSVPSSTIPNCTTATYGKTESSWSTNQYICVNSTTQGLKILKFLGNSNQDINFSWSNYTDFNYSSVNNSYVILNNNYTYLGYCIQESANTTNQSGNDSSCKLSYRGNYSGLQAGDAVYIDGNWSSGTSSFANILVYYVKPFGIVNATWQVKDDNATVNLTIPSQCLNKYPNYITLKFTTDGDFTVTKWYCMGTDGLVTLRQASSNNAYEEQMIWYVNQTSEIFSKTGSFSSTSTTSDFSDQLNIALEDGKCNCTGCNLTGTNCTIPFTFHSSTYGNIAVSSLNVISCYSNESNCTRANHTTIPVTPDGGGGGGSPSTNSNSQTILSTTGNWTMTTDGNNARYDIKMTPDSTREKVLMFQNLGTKKRTISLRCEDVNGSLCEYVTLPSSFELPVLADIKTSQTVTIDLPDVNDGTYIFNVYSKDEAGNELVVTFTVEVGNFGIFSNFIIKSGSSKLIAGLNIPILLIGLAIGIITWMGGYFVLRKMSFGSGISFILGLIALIVSITII